MYIVSTFKHIKLKPFHEVISNWGNQNFRDFPLRHEEDLYRGLVAEIMLHRTQAKQVVHVYQQFLRRYPTVFALSEAKEDGVLHPLGLHWRSKLMIAMAHVIVLSYEGNIPFEKDKLLSIPGVSDYLSVALS